MNFSTLCGQEEDYKKTHPIHEVIASMMPKELLILYVFGYEDSVNYDPDIPEMFWTNHHPPSHVFDKSTKRPLNLIQEGIKRNFIYKTIKS